MKTSSLGGEQDTPDVGAGKGPRAPLWARPRREPWGARRGRLPAHTPPGRRIPGGHSRGDWTSQLAVATPEGGKLEVELVGPDDGRVLIYQTRTAGWLCAGHVEAGVERGLRHVTYSRPGHARSERHAGRTIADCKRDRAAFEFTGTIENVNVRYTF